MRIAPQITYKRDFLEILMGIDKEKILGSGHSDRLYHCSWGAGSGRTVCGKSIRHGIRSFDEPSEWAARGPSPLFGYLKCPECLESPDLGLALLMNVNDV